MTPYVAAGKLHCTLEKKMRAKKQITCYNLKNILTLQTPERVSGTPPPPLGISGHTVRITGQDPHSWK